MTKTQKELAFLRDLYINSEWTERFTDLVDKHIGFEGTEKLFYLNAGTGNHCFELREKLDPNTAIFANCEDEYELKIARDKAAAVKADVDFSSSRFDDGIFDTVLADATFVQPGDLESLVIEAVRVTRVGGTTAFFLPSSGSFGEIFSVLWETLFNEDLGDHGRVAEAIISEIPTITRIEEIVADAGLQNIETHSAKEVFEFGNGAEFISSSLVSDFLLPRWLKDLSDDESRQVSAKLSALIDAEDGDMSFRFSVKATLVIGKKN